MKILLALLGLWGVAHGQSRVDPLVSTSKGLIRGLRANDGDYSKFLGIPYAVVDENNPFGPAIPHPGFEDTFEAYDDSAMCVQQTRTGLSGTIQCLKLHINTPNKANSQNLLPVLVWIHGGGWVGGSPEQDNMRHLVERDVIVVSITYRVGVYGFLCLDTPEVPGNQGLKDQVLALRWIKENIEAFGGDPTKITAFGESAGGMSVNLHLYSDYENLFERAIIQSGPALSYWLLVPSDKTMGLRLAEHLGYNGTDSSDAVSYLSSADPFAVTTAAYELNFIAGVGRDQSKIKPCVEQKFEGVESFLSEHPMNIKLSPKVKTSSIIIGYTDNELGFIYDDDPQKYDADNFKESLYLGFNDDNNLEEALEEIKRFYIGDKDINIDVAQEIAAYGTDIIFAHSTQRMVEQFIESGAKDVFRYVYSYVGRRNSTGATHGAELAYILDMAQYRDNLSEEEQVLINRLSTLWTNFAKFGNPTPETSDLIPVEWKPASATEQFTLDINSELTLKKRPEHMRMTFWDLFYKLYGKYQMWYKDERN